MKLLNKIITLWVIAWLVSPASAAISLLSSYSSGKLIDDQTVPLTVPANCDGLIIALAGYRKAVDANLYSIIPDSITFNGDRLTVAESAETQTTNRKYMSTIWSRVNPDIGTYNLSVVLPFTATVYWGFTAYYLSGVNTSDAVGATAILASTASVQPNDTITTEATDSWVIAALLEGATASTPVCAPVTNTTESLEQQLDDDPYSDAVTGYRSTTGAPGDYNVGWTANPKEKTALTLVEVVAFVPNTYVWDNGGADNKWSTAANWSSTLVPVDTSTVVFDATSTDSCYVDIAARWRKLTIDNAYTGKINLSTSIDTSYGNVKTGTGVTVFPSTSKIIFKGTGNDTLWSAGETYNNIVINKSAGTFRTGDRTACGDFDVDDGAFTLAYPIQYSGNATIDCNDAVAFSDSAIGTGNSKQFHVGSTVSSIAATACRRVYRGTGMTEDIDKASTFNALICDASSGLTTTGAAEYSTTSSQVPVITGASSALTINSGMTYITASSTGNMYSIGGTIDGSIANLFFFTAASTANAPAMAHTGSTNIYIQENAVGTAPVITQTGNISSGYGLILRRNNATNKTTWRQNGYSLTALWMCWGSSEATGTFDWHAKGTVTSNGAINVFGADVGASTIYDTATWVCKNNMPWLTKCTHLAAPGSNWTFTTNNSTITSSGKFYPKKITLNQATKTFAFADAMKADTLIITAGTATTAGTGNDTVVNYLQQNGGNLSIGNPLYAGYFDIDDGYLYQGAQPITAETGFDWSTDDSLAWDGTITVSGDGCAKFTGTKWYADGNLDMKGTGDFLWNINSGDRRLTGFYTMGYAGKTVTWLVPDATNKYPTFGNGARLICPSATGNIAGFLDFYFTAGAGDTIWQTNGATFAADSGEIEVTASNAGNVYVGGIKAANVFMNFRPYNQADTMRFYYLGDVTAVRMNCNSQYNYRGEQYFAGNTYTIGTGGFSAGSNGSTVHTLFSRTGGAFTSAGNFSTDGEVDFNAGTGTYAVGGNLSIGAGTNNLGTAEWTLNGAGAQALSADTLYKLTINKAGGTVTTSKSIGLGTDFTLTAGTLDISGSDTMYFGGNVTTSAGTITTAATSLWKVLKDGATLAMNALSWPITALTGSATIEDGGTFAELRPDAAGADTVKFEKLKKFIFTASDSAYWNGGAGTLNYYLTTTAGTRCTLDFEATKRFSYTAWKDMVSADTLYLNDGTNISLGGNIWP